MSRQSAKKIALKPPAVGTTEDKELAELLQTLLDRKPYYEKLLTNLVKMGLPLAKPIEQNPNLIKELKKNPKNINLIQRFLSIHLEGQPKIYHRVKLAKNCQNVIKPISNLDIEELIGLVHESVKIFDFQVLERLERKRKKYENKLTEFNYYYFLDQINIKNVVVQEQYSTFNSTEIGGVYQIQDINLLKDYGAIQYFEKTRDLRVKVHQILSAIVKILDSFKTKNIDLIQDAFLAYLDLKANLEFPFTSKKIESEEKGSDDERYSTKSEISANESHSIKIEVQKLPSKSQSLDKRVKIDTKSTQQIQQQESTNDINQKSIKKKIIKKKNIKKLDLDYPWNQIVQNKFEQIFYQSQDVNLTNLTQTIPDQKFKQSSKQKKLQNQGKRCVAFEVFDSFRYYEAKIMEIQSVNPRNPFQKYPFIQYDLDSEEEVGEEVAEDVKSEIRSIEGSPTSSMQEFIEIDYKSCSNIVIGEATTLIFNQNNFEQFIPFQAIMISDNRPNHKTTEKKKIATTKVVNTQEQQVVPAEQIQEKPPTLNTEQLLIISQLDFQIVPIDVEIRDEQ